MVVEVKVDESDNLANNESENRELSKDMISPYGYLAKLEKINDEKDKKKTSSKKNNILVEKKKVTKHKKENLSQSDESFRLNEEERKLANQKETNKLIPMHNRLKK